MRIKLSWHSYQLAMIYVIKCLWNSIIKLESVCFIQVLLYFIWCGILKNNVMKLSLLRPALTSIWFCCIPFLKTTSIWFCSMRMKIGLSVVEKLTSLISHIIINCLKRVQSDTTLWDRGTGALRLLQLP
jgi:hypothetical protein